MTDRFFFEFQDKRVEWNFDALSLFRQSAASCAANTAFVRQAFRSGNVHVRQWAARRPELTADDVLYFCTSIRDEQLRSILLCNTKLLERLSSHELLLLIEDKPSNLDCVLDALCKSDLPLHALRLGRELFKNFSGPLSREVLRPRKRKVRPDTMQAACQPLDGLFARCGSLRLPLSAQEALCLPNRVLNELGLFEALYETGDSDIKRSLSLERRVPLQIRERLAADPDLSVRLRAGAALDRHYLSTSVGDDFRFFYYAPHQKQIFRLIKNEKSWTFSTKDSMWLCGIALIRAFSLLDESRDEQTARFIRAASISEDPFMRCAAACAKLEKKTAAQLAHDEDCLVRRALLQNIQTMPQLDCSDLIFAAGRDPDLVRTVLLMLDCVIRLDLASDAKEKRRTLQEAVGDLTGLELFDARLVERMSKYFYRSLNESKDLATSDEENESGYAIEWNGFEMPVSNNVLDVVTDFIDVAEPPGRRFSRLKNPDKRTLHRRIEMADLTHRDRMARRAAVLNCAWSSDLALLLTNTELFENALKLLKVRPDVKKTIRQLALKSDDPSRIALAQKRDYAHESAGMLRLDSYRAPVSLVDCRRLTASLIELIPSECTPEEANRVHALRKALLASQDFSNRVIAAQFASLIVEEAMALANERSTYLNLQLLDNRSICDKLSLEMLLELAGSDETRLNILRCGLIAGNRKEKARELVVVDEKLAQLGAVIFEPDADEEEVVWYAPELAATPFDEVLRLDYLGIDFPLKLADLYAWADSIHETPISFPEPILSFLQSLPDESFQNNLAKRLSKVSDQQIEKSGLSELCGDSSNPDLST